MESFGTMVAFEVQGGAAAAEALARSTRLIVHATSLGGIETTIERRAKWPGEIAPPALLRLSVGCEDINDLWADLDHALAIAHTVHLADSTPVTIGHADKRSTP
jgi:cystathionine gamma-synthase